MIDGQNDPTPGPWRAGGGCVVADSNIGTHGDDKDREHYGGALVCESIRTRANCLLIAAAPSLLSAAETFIERGSESALILLKAAIEKARGTA